MKYKLFILMFAMVLLVGTVSAMDWDNSKKIIDIEEKYPQIEIRNTFGLGSTIWEGELKNNSDVCGIDCFAIKEITLYQDGSLVDDIIFKTLQEDGSWINQPIRNYQFHILNNGEWIDYKLGTELEAGTYKVKLNGQKKPSRTVDWIIKTNGKWLDEWAVWSPLKKYIYQENANSTYCSGNWDPIHHPCSHTYDGNWGTYGMPQCYYGTHSYVHFNYTKIINSTNLSLWKVKDSGGIYNLSIPSTCWNTYEDKLEFMAHSHLDGWLGHDNFSISWNCYNGTAWINLRTYLMGGAIKPRNYENGMFWNVNADAEVILNSPVGNYDFGQNPITFNATANMTGGATLVNMSLWTDETGSWEEHNVTTVTGTTNTTVWNRTITNPNNIIWNVKACDSDGDCGFAVNNATFNYNIFENNRSYENPVLESSLNNYELNVTTNGNHIPFAYLVYNGTAFLSSSSNTGNDYTFTNSVYSNVAGNISFYWYVNYGGNIINLPTSYHNVTTLSEDVVNISTNCGDLDTAMFWDFKNEINKTALEDVKIFYNFKFGVDNDTSKLLSGTFTNIENFSLCINSSISSSYLLNYGEIQYEKEGFSKRRWYVFENTRATNITINNSLYLLPSGDSTSFLIEVRDNSLNPFNNKYLTLLRWYPSINEYTIVEMGQTDEKGQTIKKIETEDVDYRIGLHNRDGTLIHLAEPIRMICLEDPCTYILTIQDEASENFANLLGVEHSLIFEDGTFKFIYNDPSQTTSLMQLDVFKLTGVEETLICTTNSTASIGILSCNVSTYSGQLKAKAFRSASPTTTIATLWHNMRTTPFKSGFGLFLTFLVVLTLFLMGIAVPVASIILGILGLIIGVIIGSINLSIVIGLSVIAGIVIHFMRKST